MSILTLYQGTLTSIEANPADMTDLTDGGSITEIVIGDRIYNLLAQEAAIGNDGDIATGDLELVAGDIYIFGDINNVTTATLPAGNVGDKIIISSRNNSSENSWEIVAAEGERIMAQTVTPADTSGDRSTYNLILDDNTASFTLIYFW